VRCSEANIGLQTVAGSTLDGFRQAGGENGRIEKEGVKHAVNRDVGDSDILYNHMIKACQSG
jgi:hypothetical protein